MFAQGGNIGEDFSIEPFFARPFDVLGDVVRVKALIGCAVRCPKRFSVNQWIGFAGADLIGQDEVVEVV